MGSDGKDTNVQKHSAGGPKGGRSVTRDVEVLQKTDYLKAVRAYTSILIWIFVSSGLIFFNKYLLDNLKFNFPLCLTMIHMAFCSTVAAFLYKVLKVGGNPEPEKQEHHQHGGGESETLASMSIETYLTKFGPVAVLFSVSLWLCNAAYLYLEVSYIQMLKAGNVVLVFLVGCLVGTEKKELTSFLNCLWIGAGLFLASYSEANFVLAGFLIQIVGVIAEAFRLQLVQLLLAAPGLKLNPITSLYYLSPLCFLCLVLPFSIIELPRLQNRMLLSYQSSSLSPTEIGVHVSGGVGEDSFSDIDSIVNFNSNSQSPTRSSSFSLVGVPIWMLLANACTAFFLNLSVYMIIGQTSALTMNVAGVVKDWLIIGLSSYLFGNVVTNMQVVGYLFAFAGVLYYNQQKLLRKKENDQSKASSSDGQVTANGSDGKASSRFAESKSGSHSHARATSAHDLDDTDRIESDTMGDEMKRLLAHDDIEHGAK